MNLEPFCELCKATQQKDQRWAEAFCATLDGVFDDDRFMDMGKVCRLFYGKSRGLSKAQFYRKRKYIIDLYRWLEQEGCVSRQFREQVEELHMDDVMSEEELSKFYFASIESAVGYITNVGRRHSMGGEDDLLPVKATVILTWYQVDLAEMTLIKKSDLNVEDKTVQIRGDNSRVVTLDENSFKLLKLFADAVNYNSFPGGTQGAYQSSIYLFRSNRSSQLNEDNIKCFIKRFNVEADAGQLISLLSIKKCGVFYETLQQATDADSVNSIIQSLAKCNRQIAFGYAKLYLRWKKKFYNREEIV